MTCCHYYEYSDTGEQVFAVDVSAIKFGTSFDRFAPVTMIEPTVAESRRTVPTF